MTTPILALYAFLALAVLLGWLFVRAVQRTVDRATREEVARLVAASNRRSRDAKYEVR